MKKISLALKSRTVWTILALFVLNGLPAVTELLPVTLLPIANLILTVLAMYFKVNPSQNYKS